MSSITVCIQRLFCQVVYHAFVIAAGFIVFALPGFAQVGIQPTGEAQPGEFVVKLRPVAKGERAQSSVLANLSKNL